jgi:hypothetical protein
VFDNEGQPVLVMALIAQILHLPAPATPEMEAELRAAAQASVQLGYLLETPDQVRSGVPMSFVWRRGLPRMAYIRSLGSMLLQSQIATLERARTADTRPDVVSS